MNKEPYSSLIFGLGMILFLGLSPVSLCLISRLGLILFLGLSLVFLCLISGLGLEIWVFSLLDFWVGA